MRIRWSVFGLVLCWVQSTAAVGRSVKLKGVAKAMRKPLNTELQSPHPEPKPPDPEPWNAAKLPVQRHQTLFPQFPIAPKPDASRTQTQHNNNNNNKQQTTTTTATTTHYWLQ